MRIKLTVTRILPILISIFLLTISCCASPSKGLIESNVERNLAPAISDEDFKEVFRLNSNFAFDLYREMSKEDGNIFFSPYSVSIAVAMAWEGARGETERELTNVMHFLAPRSKTHEAFNKAGILLEKEKSITLELANSIWIQYNEHWNKEFLDVLKANYDSGIHAENITGSS